MHYCFLIFYFLLFIYLFINDLSGLHIVEQSLWKAVPHYLRRVSAALKKVLPYFLINLHYKSYDIYVKENI